MDSIKSSLTFLGIVFFLWYILGPCVTNKVHSQSIQQDSNASDSAHDNVYDSTHNNVSHSVQDNVPHSEQDNEPHSVHDNEPHSAKNNMPPTKRKNSGSQHDDANAKLIFNKGYQLFEKKEYKKAAPHFYHYLRIHSDPPPKI